MLSTMTFSIMTFPIRHRRLRFRPVFRAVAVFLAASVVACGAGENGGSGGGRGDEAPVLTIGAASSLTDALEEIAVRFEASGAGRVELAFDSSAVIAGQIGAGAPIDVFVSADASLVEDLAASGEAAGDPVTFAGNRVVLVTPAGNPAGVTGLADLVDVDLVALCDPTAPCGAAAVEALERAGVDPAGLTVTDGRNARETLRSVADGGVDAGIVFATDALVAGDRVETIPIPGADERLVEYRAVRVTDAEGRSDVAEAFVAFLAGSKARGILTDHGFDPAPEVDAAADDLGRGEASPVVPAGDGERAARSGDVRSVGRGGGRGPASGRPHRVGS